MCVEKSISLPEVSLIKNKHFGFKINSRRDVYGKLLNRDIWCSMTKPDTPQIKTQLTKKSSFNAIFDYKSQMLIILVEHFLCYQYTINPYNYDLFCRFCKLEYPLVYSIIESYCDRRVIKRFNRRLETLFKYTIFKAMWIFLLRIE